MAEREPSIMANGRPRENWGTKIGVILAVAGSAVGLGNFLRFPGEAASHGGGIFMIPYFISLLLVGLPICWAEWTMGRYGGAHGHNSAPGIFRVLWRNPVSKYFGVLALIIPVVIYMYYVYIEVWCLSYAIDYAMGTMGRIAEESGREGQVDAFAAHFMGMVGMEANGWPGGRTLLLVVLVFFLNFTLIYRGVTKGIETFCKFAMPALILIALFILVRVLTLGTPDAAVPERNLSNALGAMWNPKPIGEAGSVWESLLDPGLWLAASGQIFFSLSVGFGIILNYSSYLRPDDDVALSGLSSSAANEFCEVILGGLITLPVAYLFLSQAEINAGGTLSLGFFTLPMVFVRMPLGELFGALFFFMLFVAAVTSSLSMLQPAIAFLEEGFALGRKASVAFLGLICSIGGLIVIHWSKGLVALDTMDFWVGTFLIFALAMIQVIMFAWIFGVKRGKDELEKGAEIPIPKVYWFIIKYVSPVYLVGIFVLFCHFKLPDYIKAIQESPDRDTIWGVLAFIGLIAVFFAVLVNLAGKRWEQIDAEKEGRS